MKQESKSLHNTTANGAKENVKDIQFWGDGDLFKLLSKASSEAEGWMKSTKAMPIEGVGCVVQVTTQQRNPDGSYSIAEALTYVPGVQLTEEVEGEKVVKRKLVADSPVEEALKALAGVVDVLESKLKETIKDNE